MNALIVYESMYGNTHEIAQAIAEGLGSIGVVQVMPVTKADPDSAGAVDLLVVGGPTHVHGMSRKASRMAAAETASKDDSLDLDPDAEGDGLREWFRQISSGAGTFGAAFDTRIDKPVVLTGSAAKGIARQLKRHRFVELTDPESFLVEDSAGPLKDGELDRARRWGTELAARCGADADVVGFNRQR